jgi:hypothetical protein
MKKLLIGAALLGAIYAGVVWSLRQSRQNREGANLDQWEGEGGSVPVEDDRIAAQTGSRRGT